MNLDFKNNSLGYFKFYYSVIGPKLIITIFLSIIVSLLDGIGLAMLMPLLQAVEGGSTSTKESMGQLHYITVILENLGFSLTLNTVLIIIVSLFLLKGIVKFIEQNNYVSIQHFFIKKLRHQLVTSLESLSYQGFLKLDAGTIQNAFIAEIQRMSLTIRNYLNWGRASLMLITYIVLAVLANYQFALLVAVAAGLTNFIYRNIYTRVKLLSAEVSKKGSNFNGYLIEAIHYFKYLRSTNYFILFSKKLRTVIDNTETLNKKSDFYSAITNSIREPMIIVIVVMVIYLQVNWMGGSLGAIILSLLLFYRGLNFLIEIQNEWQNFIKNIGAIKMVTSVINEMNAHNEISGNILFKKFKDNIELNQVEVHYGSSKILKNVSLLIPKNKTIALAGSSGAGKTTIANIICALIKPNQGSVLIDSVKIENYNVESYRSKVGYISQDPVVFNDTIFNNITFWSEANDINIQRFWKVVEMASLNDFIFQQPEKENTPLGDHGILISGGQKQRISIARELFKEPQILILDEATSALDSETEIVIQENIENLHGSLTMIIIAHRLSTIRNADIIYLIEKGEIKASGDFTSLIAVSDPFKKMVSLQGFN